MKKRWRKKSVVWILAAVLTAGSILSGVERKIEAAEIEKTREETAVWVCQEMEKRGEKVDAELLERIKREKRISDLGRVNKENREAVLQAYHWGIMMGDSNGSYSKSRSFHGKKKMTKKEWTEIKVRIENPSRRLKLSPDGQLCRTTKLPVNYKKFPYILESYPNGYYMGKFDYEWYEGKQTEGKDYINPSGINKSKFINWKTTYPFMEIRKKYEEDWKNCILTNLETRLNADYRKVSKDYKWINRLRNTYYLFNDPVEDLDKTLEIEEYVEGIKKNKVIIKGTVDMDSSTLYQSVSGYFMRAHIRFKIVSAEKMPENQTELIFGDHVYFKNLKKGVWREAIVDIGLGTANAYSDGGDFAVVEDSLIEPRRK